MSTSKAMDFSSESYCTRPKPEFLATIDLNIEGTLSEGPEDGSKSVEKSDPVTPLPLSVKVSESNSLPATQELDPAHEADNPDEAGLQTLTLAMEAIKSPVESQLRKRRQAGKSLKLGIIEKAEDRPEWLPPEWEMERRARGTGSTAGMIDTFYYDPTGRQFRSKSEVIFYLDTGKRRSRKSKPKDNLDLANVMPLNCAGPSEQNGSTSKRKKTGSNGNTNPLEKVRWAISFDADGSGTFNPVIGDETVPEQDREDWDPSFAFLTEGSASSPKGDAE